MVILHNMNIGLRFLLEVIALISLGYWGFKTKETLILKVCFGIGLPLCTAILWGLFGSPNATFPISELWQWILVFMIYLASTLALYSSGAKYLGAVYFITAIINSIFMIIWKQ